MIKISIARFLYLIFLRFYYFCIQYKLNTLKIFTNNCNDMKIKRLIVRGLFHTFDHEIRFNNGGVVIIIGENGIGKTTLLQIINSIFTKKFDFLFSIDFDSIEIDFTEVVWIIKKEKNGLNITNQKINKNFIIKPIDERNGPFFHRHLMQIDDDKWLDRRIGRVFTREELINRFGYDPLDLSTKTPEWIETFIKENRVLFIQTQRLYKTDHERDRDYSSLKYMIKDYSEELVKLLQQNNTLFTAKSIQLDSTFPIRLLKVLKSSKKDFNQKIDEIIDEINSLNTYRNLLSSVGIIDRQDDDFISKSLNTIVDNPTALSILDLYISDNKQKLDVFRDTAKKLEILLEIINKRFKHKKLCIDKQEGFKVKSNYEDRDISVEELSSGEQNELIIFYTLLFKTNNNDIVLIDEPEISLHIAWQQQLIDDLREIANETGVSLLISTHSPDIIGNNWSLVQALSSRE